MPEMPISVDEFKTKLVALCVESTLTGLPRKHRDRQIILRSSILTLDPTAQHTEKEINAALQAWLKAVDRLHYLDHVTLRRALVDDGYFERDAAGKFYRLRPSTQWRMAFEPSIGELHVDEILESGEAMLQQRKRLHARNSGDHIEPSPSE